MASPNNHLLNALSVEDLAALKPHLKPVFLEHQTLLCEAGEEIKTAYFPTGSVVSLVVALTTGQIVEVAMVGKDGVIGASAALHGGVSATRAIVQLAGPALSCSVQHLRDVVRQSTNLQSRLSRQEQAIFAQAAQSTACMAIHTIETRLVRWLLRARDLAGSDTLKFTQEYIAEMMGVRRTSVTPVARTLQEAGMIRYSRGTIEILDVEAMQNAACECYFSVKSHYDALLGEVRSFAGNHSHSRSALENGSDR